MFHPPLEKLIESKRFVEAMYFGAIDLASNPTSELHLYLGIACCATIKSIAELERYLALESTTQEDSSVVSVNGLSVSRNTLLVNEGLHHLLQAKQLNPHVMIPASLKPVTVLIIQYLQDYLHQEFHGFSVSSLDYTLSQAALGAIVLLCKLQGYEPEEITKLTTTRIEAAHELIAKLSSQERRQAVFYKMLSK
jgi:hypothetical protein